MSNRHDDLKVGSAERKRRKSDKRRARRDLRQHLHTIVDIEDAVIDEPKVDQVPQHAIDVKPKRLRHWKLKAWKRRTNERHARNLAIEQLARADT